MKDWTNLHICLVLKSVLMTLTIKFKTAYLSYQFYHKIIFLFLGHHLCLEMPKGPSFLLFFSLFPVLHWNFKFSIHGILSWHVPFMHLSQRRLNWNKAVSKAETVCKWNDCTLLRVLAYYLDSGTLEYLMKDYTNYIFIWMWKVSYIQRPSILVWEVWVNLTSLLSEKKEIQSCSGTIFNYIIEFLNKVSVFKLSRI